WLRQLTRLTTKDAKGTTAPGTLWTAARWTRLERWQDRKRTVFRLPSDYAGPSNTSPLSCQDRIMPSARFFSAQTSRIAMTAEARRYARAASTVQRLGQIRLDGLWERLGGHRSHDLVLNDELWDFVLHDELGRLCPSVVNEE